MPTQRTSSDPPATPPLRRVVVDPCTCGHGKDAHQHYRPGSDCGVCGATACAVYQPQKRGGVLKRLLRKG